MMPCGRAAPRRGSWISVHMLSTVCGWRKGYRGLGVEMTNEIGPAEADISGFIRGSGYVGEKAIETAKGGPIPTPDRLSRIG